MKHTPETDAAWVAYQMDSTCDEGDPWGLAARLERERDEAREVASAWRENWRNGASMSLIASTKFPWEKF